MTDRGHGIGLDIFGDGARTIEGGFAVRSTNNTGRHDMSYDIEVKTAFAMAAAIKQITATMTPAPRDSYMLETLFGACAMIVPRALAAAQHGLSDEDKLGVDAWIEYNKCVSTEAKPE